MPFAEAKEERKKGDAMLATVPARFVASPAGTGIESAMTVKLVFLRAGDRKVASDRSVRSDAGSP